MPKYFFSVLLLAVLALPSHARDKHDHAAPDQGTAIGAMSDGDSAGTYSVICTTSPTAVAILAPTVDRSRRHLRFQNRSSVFLVNIGTSTLSVSDTWTLGESTNTATNPLFDTHNSGQFYCTLPQTGTTPGPAANATLQIIEEYAIEDRSGLP